MLDRQIVEVVTASTNIAALVVQAITSWSVPDAPRIGPQGLTDNGPARNWRVARDSPVSRRLGASPKAQEAIAPVERRVGSTCQRPVSRCTGWANASEAAHQWLDTRAHMRRALLSVGEPRGPSTVPTGCSQVRPRLQRGWQALDWHAQLPEKSSTSAPPRRIQRPVPESTWPWSASRIHEKAGVSGRAWLRDGHERRNARRSR